jgi:hypothetical protein
VSLKMRDHCEYFYQYHTLILYHLYCSGWFSKFYFIPAIQIYCQKFFWFCVGTWAIVK